MVVLEAATLCLGGLITDLAAKAARRTDATALVVESALTALGVVADSLYVTRRDAVAD